MNIKQLEYFVNVAEALNFTKAAERCFISQTAMSQQIKALEETVGVPLLIRNHHKVELTAAGRIYLNEARAIIERSSEAMRLARTASESIEGSLSIGYIRGYGQRDFVEQLQRFSTANPNVKISLYRDNMSILMDHLENGDCDVVFTSSPHSWAKYPGVDHHKIAAYPLMAVLPTGHWLASRNSLTYSDLSEEQFIMMQPSGRPTDEMEESLLIYEKGGFVPNIVALHQDPEEILLCVAVGMGISLLPEYMIRLHQESQDLRIVPLVGADGSVETLDLEVAWSKASVNPIVRQLLETLEK